jgi:phosphoadenosine phosphosulfate reductase
MCLIDNTLFGVEDKVAIAIERLRTFEPAEGYYLAFSGGKDSCVILDLAKRAGVKFDAHYNLTTVDPPELVHFIRREHPEVEVHKPEKTMWQLMREYHMPPLRNVRYCCAELKEKGGSGRLVVTGIRWAESSRRSKRRMTEHCMKDKSKTYLHPVIDWHNKDIWDYIHGNNLPYCSLYDEGFTRIGCIMCPMAGPLTRKLHAERWPKYAEHYRRVFKEIVASGHPLVRWSDADAMWNWWIHQRSNHELDDQTVLFE